VASFVFDARAQQYRHVSGPAAGRFISIHAVRRLLSQQVDAISSDLKQIAGLLAASKISLLTWESETARAIALLHHQAYMLGAGGERGVGDLGRDALSRRISEQLHFLRGFSQEIRAGTVSEAQFLSRVEMYAQASRGSYEAGRQLSHQRAGFSWERRRRTKTESCPPCVAYASLGWQAIGSLPHPGAECDCRSNCGCYKEYQKGASRPESDWADFESELLSARARCQRGAPFSSLSNSFFDNF